MVFERVLDFEFFIVYVYYETFKKVQLDDKSFR